MAKVASVTIRKRAKRGSKMAGFFGLYLDIYSKGERTTRTLDLILRPEKTRADKALNTEVMQAAEVIRAQTLIELQGGGIRARRGKTIGAMLEEQRGRANTESVAARYNAVINILAAAQLINVVSEDITAGWFESVLDALRARHLKESTTRLYIATITAALNHAYKMDELDKDVAKYAPKIAQKDGKREYLTIDEVRRLKATECDVESVKRAFLFACLCGLRCVDINALRWQDIEQVGDRMRVGVVQQKTSEVVYIDLPPQACEYLGERGEAQMRVFDLPPKHRISVSVRTWVARAGISKPVTFHTSRHTFAVLLLEQGVDIYTVSKLLGHRSVRTTQIYADITDKRRREATSLIPSFDE